MKVWAVVPLKAWRFQVSKANSEELRSHILEGAQVIFSTTTVAGEQSMAELYVTYISRSQTWQLQIPFKWTCLFENHLQMGDVPLPAKGYCTSICICKCI